MCSRLSEQVIDLVRCIELGKVGSPPSAFTDAQQIIQNRRACRFWMMDASGQNQRQITNFPYETWEPMWVKYAND